jgi:hypothetical protein
VLENTKAGERKDDAGNKQLDVAQESSAVALKLDGNHLLLPATSDRFRGVVITAEQDRSFYSANSSTLDAEINSRKPLHEEDKSRVGNGVGF